MSGITILEEKHMLRILIFLRMCGDSTARKMDIYNAISTNPRMPDKLNTLEKSGLVTQTFDKDSRSIWVTLTKTGTQIADRLIFIDNIMGVTE